MDSIKHVLRRKFIVVILFSIISAIALSNLGFMYLSIDYINKKYDEHSLEIVNTIHYLYEEEKYDKIINYLEYYSNSTDMYIRFYDKESNLIYISENIDSDNILEFHTFDIKVLNEIVGMIEIAHDPNSTIFDKDKYFIFKMNILFLFSFFISLVMAYFINERMSRKIIEPVNLMQKNSSKIIEEKYSEIESVSSDIREFFELSMLLSYLAEKLEKEKKYKKQLVQDISHEIKTPLTILKSHLEAIIEGVWEADNEKISICHNEVLRLSELANGLNRINQCDEENVVFQEINISKILEDVVEFITVLFNEKNITLITDIDKDIVMEGYSNYIKQIFLNILINCYQYTPKEGRVNVTLKKDNNIVISIKDNGVGISEEDLPYIFNRLYRADKARLRKDNGFGVGLYVVKTYVELHGGTVDVRSKVGEGTDFTLIFNDID